MATDVRMIRRRADSTEYRRAPIAEVRRRLASRLIVFEGVDGDEETDTVTYWYRPRRAEDD